MTQIINPFQVGDKDPPTAFPASTVFARFDGTNDYVDIPYNVGMSAGHSLAFWLRKHSLSNTLGVFGFDFSTANEEIWMYLYANAKARVKWISTANTNSRQKETAASIPVDTWVHVVVTRSANTVQIYIDGVKDTATETAGSGSPPNDGNRALGHGYISLFAEVDLRDFRWYSKVLTQSEIDWLESEGLSGTDPTAATLKVHFRFEGGAANESNVANSGSESDGTAHDITATNFWNL